MKRYILYTMVALVALWFSFRTENLTEKINREEMDSLAPEQLVGRLMSDSLNGLAQLAVTLQELAAGCGDEAFQKQHGRVLGIGSPTFYIIKGACDNAMISDEEIHAVVNRTELTIPLKHVFGNTAREASGWFDIDDFQNMTDFNAVSAAMNNYIASQLKQYKPGEHIEFLGAVAIKEDSDLRQLTLIPYQLK